MNKRNVTLALPEDLLRRVKVLAALQETSISALLVQSLEKLLDESADYDLAMRQLLANMEKGYPLGIGDKPSWTRESLHERR